MFQPLSSILPKQFSYGLMATLLVFITVFFTLPPTTSFSIIQNENKGDQALSWSPTAHPQ